MLNKSRTIVKFLEQMISAFLFVIRLSKQFWKNREQKTAVWLRPSVQQTFVFPCRPALTDSKTVNFKPGEATCRHTGYRGRFCQQFFLLIASNFICKLCIAGVGGVGRAGCDGLPAGGAALL